MVSGEEQSAQRHERQISLIRALSSYPKAGSISFVSPGRKIAHMAWPPETYWVFSQELEINAMS